MPKLFKKIRQFPVGDIGSPSNGESNPIPCLSESGRYVLLNDDLVYSILTAASNMAKSDLDRREALFAYVYVCHVWSKAAQSILFRRVFLQIRSSMIALLNIIDHKTERGRRLAGYIQSATIKLSTYQESADPPTLPMIHARHLPALLSHTPNLSTLDLTLGAAELTPDIVAAISRGPQITTLTLTLGRYTDLQFLADETNPWPHLESISIKHYTSAILIEDYAPPRIRLAQATIRYTSGGRFDELDWLTRYSKETLTHVSLISETFSISNKALRHSRLRNIQSLTLGRVAWNEEIIGILNTFIGLKELCLISGIHLDGPFPSNLPDTIEHFTATVPFLASRGSEVATPDMTRPAMLKSFTAIYVKWPEYVTGQNWAKEYAQMCEEEGISTDISNASRTTSEAWLQSSTNYVKSTDSKIPLRIRQSDGKFQPTPSQLELTDFEVIIGGKKVAQVSASSSASGSSVRLTTHKNLRNPLSGIRALISGWKT